MKGSKVTISSKNQISIPSTIVRKLHLNRHRQLQVRQRGNEIILTPLPSLSQSLANVWQTAAHHVQRPLTDDEIKQSVRDISANKK